MYKKSVKLKLTFLQNVFDENELKVQEQKLNDVGIVLEKVDKTKEIFAVAFIDIVNLRLVLNFLLEEAQKEAIKELIKYILKRAKSFAITLIKENKKIELKNFDEIPDDKIQQSLDSIFVVEAFKTQNDYVIGVYNRNEDIWEFMTTVDYVKKYVIPKKSNK